MKKQLILKALTDPKFRKLLQENPMEAMEMAEIRGGYIVDPMTIIDTVHAVEKTISEIGEQILCTSGGSGCCGIAYA